MSKRLYWFILSIVVLLALAAAWWGTRPLPGKIVAARLGEESWKLPAEAMPSRKVKLGGSTRKAVEVSVPSHFVVDLPPRTSEVWVSTGLEKADHGSAVRFEIAAEEGDKWEPLFLISVPPERGGEWIDHRVEVPKRYRDARRLRFAVYFSGEGKATRVKAYWGSVLALKPKGIRRWRAWLDPQQAWDRPNVILISLDTLGARHLSWFGAPAGVSPHIDAWLDRSFSFRRAYAQYPNTLGSHASLFTGLYPTGHGVDETLSRKVPSSTLAAALAEAGYVAFAFTENAFVASDFGFDNGFDWYDNGRAPLSSALSFLGAAEETFSRARHALDEWLSFGVPFFLFVHTYEVHSPYTPKDPEALALVNRLDPDYRGPFGTAFDAGDVELEHNTGIRQLPERECMRAQALYRGEIHYLDRLLHEFLTHQQALPGARNTLVIVTADHGDEFCEHGKLGHGETLYNPVLHVPLAFYWPGRVERGTYDEPVELVDVKPTVLELAGLPVPPGLHGLSLAPLLLRKEAMLVRQPAFAEMRFTPFPLDRAARGKCTAMGLPADCRVERVAVQDRRFKLISSLYPPFEFLFDLETDPGETRDVAAEFPAEVERLRQWVRKYRDGWQAADGSPEKTSPAVDPATLERLRGLGYVE